MTDEAIEAAAMALFDANVFGTRSPVAVRDRPTVHDVARIALAAAVPYIEAGLRAKIAAELLREVAAADPVGHKARLGRGYDGYDPAFYPPSGLQRATEQQPDDQCLNCGRPVWRGDDGKLLHGDGARRCLALSSGDAVGGSDTPADQPEPHQNYGLEVEWGYRYPNGGNVYAELSREQAEAAVARVPGSALYRRDPRWLPVAAAPVPADQPDDEPCDLTEIIATIRAAKTDAHAGGPLAKWLAMVYGPRARRRALAPPAPADQPEQDVQR